MTAGLQREFPVQSVRIGSQFRVNSTIHCSKCPTQSTIDTPQTIADKFIRQKFERRGWIVSRDRQHDICPTCVGVNAANRLANRFKVTADGAPVPTPGELAQRTVRSRDTATAELLARTFSAKPKAAASPAPIQAPPRPVPPPIDPRVEVLERELSELRAANELQLETSQAILVESRRSNELLDISLRQGAQMIEAIARLAGTSGRQGETILGAIGQAANALHRLAEVAEARRRPPEIDVTPRPALPAPAAAAPAPAPAPRTTPRRGARDWALARASRGSPRAAGRAAPRRRSATP